MRKKIQVLIDEWVTDPMGYAGVETAGEAVQKVVQTYIGDENYLPVEIGTDPKQWASRVMECLEEAQFPTAFGLAMEAEEYTQVKEKPVKEALSDMEHSRAGRSTNEPDDPCMDVIDSRTESRQDIESGFCS